MTAHKAAIVELADEVTADLNKKKGAWSRSFNAERKYRPTLKFEDIDQVRVEVVPLTWTKTPASRAHWQTEYTIGIGINYRADPKTNAQPEYKYDPLIKLAEEIGDHYEDTRPTLANCVLTAVEFGGASGTPYAHEVIDSQFTSVIQLTFRKWR